MEELISEEGKDSWTEHKTLKRACVQDHGGQCVVPNPYHLRPGEEVPDPEKLQCRHPQAVKLQCQLVLNNSVKS